MSDNMIFTAVVVLLVVAHGVALGVWLLGGRAGGVLVLNLAVAGGVLAYWLRRLPYVLAAPADEQVLALLAFEAVVVVLALWGFGGGRWPVVASGVACGLHLCVSVAAVVFALTFRMTRLI